jgi:hypothetical protein
MGGSPEVGIRPLRCTKLDGGFDQNEEGITTILTRGKNRWGIVPRWDCGGGFFFPKLDGTTNFSRAPPAVWIARAGAARPPLSRPLVSRVSHVVGQNTNDLSRYL